MADVGRATFFAFVADRFIFFRDLDFAMLFSSSRRRLKKAHLLRWRPRPQVQRTESTPHLRIDSALVSRRPMATAQLELRGAASHLDLFEPPASSRTLLVYSLSLSTSSRTAAADLSNAACSSRVSLIS